MSAKERCLAEMRASFRELDSVVDAIPTERLTEVGVTEDWSARDLLAHLAGYERFVAAAIFGDLTGTTPTNQDYYGRDDVPSQADDANVDNGNAWVVARARTVPVESVLAEYRWAHHRLVEAVEACAEPDLEDPARFPFCRGKTLLSILPGQCWAHHRMHLPQLQGFADRMT